MANRVATIKGTFLLPTVSKNRRLYTKENIGKAVSRMKARLNDESGLPLTMFPSHGEADSDDALSTIGRITKVNQEDDGSATFEADIADTSAGRDMAVLVDPDNPFVKGLSIRGAWMGQPKTVEADDGKDATTADDLDVYGIDWTGRPGVEGAQITDAALFESAGIEFPIFESADGEALFFDETATETTDKLSEVVEAIHSAVDLLAEAGDAPGDGSKPYGNVTYADPGYQKDKKKRYPVDTAAHVRAAWAYINKAKNAGAYTAAQLSRIKGKIKSAAKKFKIDISESVLDLPLQEAMEVYEAYASMCIYNADGSVSVNGSADADEIQNLARRIAYAAISGINALDPDNDDDIDLEPVPTEAVVPNDNDMESDTQTCGECQEADIPANFMYCPTCGTPLAAAESAETESSESEEEEENVTNETEAVVAEDKTTESETDETVETTETEQPAAPATVTLTNEQFTALLAAVAPKPAEGETETESEPEVKTLTEAEVEAIKEEARIKAETDVIESMRQAGALPPREGYSQGPTAGQFGTPVSAVDKIPTQRELSEMSEEEFLHDTYEALTTQPRWVRLFNRADAAARGF